MSEINKKLQNNRHSLAHLLAASVMKLYPDAKRTIGPAIDDGFYYDFEFQEPIVEKDLSKIEKQMKKLLQTWDKFERSELTKEEALAEYPDNQFKRELIEEFTADGSKVSFYKSGDFSDLCRGGHAESMKEIKPDSFKLDRIAGAYWRGDEKNPMLTRIYGLAFETKEALDAHLAFLEEAKKRDHKKLGKELGLFAFSPLVGPGYPLFLPKGTIVFDELKNFMKAEKEKRGYSFVHIPHVAKTELYERSGHLGKYDAMMPIMIDSEDNQFVMKAMNCPHHFELYNAQPHSYKDLPIRYAENTTVYRNEKSGELSGLVRVKSLTQDDTHHFVRHDQIKQEIEIILGLMDIVYSTFGFSDYKVQISVRGSENKDQYFGDDALWEMSEQILIDSVKAWGKPYIVEQGEAAFYGPKIDIMVKDSIGREWQLTTVQLDFSQPKNFDLTYTDDHGNEQLPAVIHAAILGSIERFMGVLIEHYAGAFPLWLAPEQVVIIPIGEGNIEYARHVSDELKQHIPALRVNVDTRSESMGKKIREASLNKVPYMIIIGDKEIAEKKISVRGRGDEDLGQVEVSEFRDLLKNKIEKRA